MGGKYATVGGHSVDLTRVSAIIIKDINDDAEDVSVTYSLEYPYDPSTPKKLLGLV